MKNIYLVSFLLLNCFVKNAALDKGSSSSEISELIKEYDDKVRNLFLPVNYIKKPESSINLYVKIPDTFVSVFVPKTSSGVVMLEFIPNADASVNNWSEIITVQSFVNRGIPAHYFIENLKKVAESVEIVESDSKKHENYLESSLLMTYTDKGRKEILYVAYYSGPYDCSGFQYAIALNDSVTKKQAIEKIKEFISKNLKVYKF